MRKTKKSNLLKLLWWTNPLLRILPTISTDFNHRTIRNKLATNPQTILRPCPPLFEGGSIEHYYHFLFDLIFPVIEVNSIAHSRDALRIAAQTPLAGIASDLFGGQIEFIEPSTITNDDIAELRGMNPRVYRLSKHQIKRFRRFIDGWVADKPSTPGVDLLLIERTLPTDYYLSAHCSVKGGGSLRRSILNHSEVKAYLRNLLKTGMLRGIKSMMNVKLENVPLQEQIHLFSNAKLIVGQHGAGLSNIIFCKNGTRLLEINDRRECLHFRMLSRVSGVRHSFMWVDSPHPELSMDKLGQSLQHLIKS